MVVALWKAAVVADGDFDPERILSALSDAEVRYVLIGGMADREKDRRALPRLRSLLERTATR